MVIVFLPPMSQVNFSYVNKITLFCSKNSSWSSKTVGRWVQARHQMAFICREFDRREKTGCEGTSESGFAICCTSSSAFLFAECKYIRICVCLTARTKVHFCKFDAITAEWFSDLCLWIKQTDAMNSNFYWNSLHMLVLFIRNLLRCTAIWS